MDEPSIRKFSPVKLYSNCTIPSGVEVLNRTPIIFIHGLFSSNRSWKMVNPVIGKNTSRKTYAIDLRNHGKSEWVDEMSMERMIDDLENFMVTENIPKAVLVGHSLGGRVALGLALRKPEMVEKLVAEDVVLVDTEKGRKTMEELLSSGQKVRHALNFLPSTMSEMEAQTKVQTYLVKAFPEWIANVSSNQTPVFPFHKAKSGKFEWELNLEGFSKIDTKVTHITFGIDLKNDPVYEGDLLVLFAKESYIVTRESLDSYYKYFPKCQIHTFEAGKHTLHAEFPNKYIEVVSEYINAE